MSKQIPPNGCLFCELPHDKHWSRLDGLHPSGVWTWVEPSDRVRLQRMKRNRAIREGNTMDYTTLLLSSAPSYYWPDMWVTYHGKSRRGELGSGQIFKVVEVREDAKAVAIDAGVYGIQWVAPNALRVAKAEKPDPAESMTLERAEDILNPYLPAVAALDAEIKRLKDKITELETLRKGLASL